MTTAAPPISRDQARVFRDRIRRDPAWFATNVIGVDLYDKQVEIAESVRDNEQTSVNGANGVGKDFTIGQAVIPWWIASYAPNAKVILTAPTHRQIQDIVWRETRDAYNTSRVPLGGRMLPEQAKWDIDDNCFALGFATNKAMNITGFHSPHLLVIVSEAHNCDEDTFTMLKRLHPERLLLSGNPFTQAGEFFSSHHDKRHLYNAITITAWDSPNVQESTDRYPGVVTRRDIEKAAADWGEDSALYKATVDAEFAQSADGLIPLAWLLRARGQVEEDEAGKIRAGLDVAGPGEDETSLHIGQGPNILKHKAWRKEDPRGEVVAELMPYKDRLEAVNVDSAGLGWGMYLHLRDIFGRVVNPINVGESPRDSEKFANLKAELYWGMRMRFEDDDVHGLDDETARSQLAGIRYEHNARGQVVIESKDQARKRGVKSPDRAESLMLLFANKPKGAKVYSW